MNRTGDILNNVRVAAPCHESWDRMEGDERIRHCAACRLNVFNLSDMTRDEAERLIRESQGRLCVRYYQRVDGTILTRDCPVGVRAIRRRLAFALSCAVVMFASLCAFAAGRVRWQTKVLDDALRSNERAWRAKQPPPIRYVLDKIDPLPIQVMGGAGPAPTRMGRVVKMGEMVQHPFTHVHRRTHRRVR